MSAATKMRVRLCEVALSITDGDHQAPPKAAQGVPFLTIAAINDGTLNIDRATRYVPESYYTNLKPERRAGLGDILFSVTGSIGISAIVDDPRPFTFQRHIAIIKPNRQLIDNRYLLHAMRTDEIKEQALAVATGTAQLTISLGGLRDFEIAVPSLPEQRRIVGKLDGLRSRSSRATNELDRIPKLIERYKQAILAKAFSGELTKDWRKQHPKIGTGAHTLTKIAAARDSLLEGRVAARKGPVSDGEAGRVPVELSGLPATWAQSKLEMITSPVRLIQYGILKPGNDVPGGVPYVKVMNIQGGRVRLEKIRRTTAEIHGQYRRSAISTGDILLSIRGTVGRLAIVPPELDGGNITQDSVRIDVLPCMNVRFVYWYLHSPAAQDYFAKNQKGVAVRGINVGDVRPMEIPIPSEAEQLLIVSLIERALEWLDKITIEHAHAERLLPKLDQAILAKAFRGELVPQEPNDEPAFVLLERI